MNRVAVLVLFFTATAACSSNSTAGAPDAATADGSSPDAATVPDASGDASIADGASPPPQDASGDASSSASSDGSTGAPSDAAGDGASACNTLANIGSPVTITEVAQDPPPPQGGTVVDGTYVLTSETTYTGPGGATGTTGTQTVTIQITGNTIQVAKDFDPPTSTYTLSTSGTTFSTTGVCPPGVGPLAGSYTATPTSFTVLLGPSATDAGPRWIEEVFTKH
jgi:hypothetical protein